MRKWATPPCYCCREETGELLHRIDCSYPFKSQQNLKIIKINKPWSEKIDNIKLQVRRTLAKRLGHVRYEQSIRLDKIYLTG
jgi:hypothetical protein